MSVKKTARLRRRSHTVATIALGAAVSMAGGTSHATTFPAKPVRLVVANGPGVFVDTVARAFVDEMAKQLGSTIYVENKSGAQGLIGYEHVARDAAADGHTMVIFTVTDVALAPLAIKDLRFNVSDLQPLIAIGGGRLTLTSPATAAWNTFAEFLAVAKATPNKYNYGWSTYAYQAPMLALTADLGVEMTSIPYGSGPAFVQGLMAGDTQIAMTTETLSSTNNKLRPLAVSGKERSAVLPNVPTLAEIGLPNLPGWTLALAVRRGTPKEAVDALYNAAFKAKQQTSLRERFSNLKVELAPESESTPEAVSKSIRDQAAYFSGVLKKTGAQLGQN